MHNPDYSPDSGFVHVQFSDSFVPSSEPPQLLDLIQSKIDNREYFFGIEISAKSNSTLNYQRFAVLPLFTSLVWFQSYSRVDSISEVDSIKIGKYLQQGTVVVPHFTCYRAVPERVQDFLSLNFANVIALRGDDVEEGQHYKYASELVTDIRKNEADNVTIGVGGYPQMHPRAKSRENDLRYLKQKVDSGADFIITQLCFDSVSIVEFVGNCRKNGITVPIIVGVFVPETYGALRRMLQVTEVPAPRDMGEYKSRQKDAVEFKEYAVKSARELILDVFGADVGVYGIQFFTMNHFGSVERLVNDVIVKLNKKT